MDAITKIKKLTKDEIIHLIDSKKDAAEDLIAALAKNRITQRASEGRGMEGCFECRLIAKKIGMEG